MSPRANLLAGIALLALAVMETLTGQSLGGYGRSADRTDDPKNYWGLQPLDMLQAYFLSVAISTKIF
jgi:hypothetical protein